MNRRRVMAACLFLAAMTFGTPSSALDRAQLIARLDSFRDPAAARRLEDRLAFLVERKDEAGLRQLGNDVRAKDGALLARLEGLTAKPRESATAVDPELARVALSMGPCYHANLLIRKVVLAIAAGEAKPSLRDGRQARRFAGRQPLCRDDRTL